MDVYKFLVVAFFAHLIIAMSVGAYTDIRGEDTLYLDTSVDANSNIVSGKIGLVNRGQEDLDNTNGVAGLSGVTESGENVGFVSNAGDTEFAFDPISMILSIPTYLGSIGTLAVNTLAAPYMFVRAIVSLVDNFAITFLANIVVLGWYVILFIAIVKMVMGSRGKGE